MVKLKNIFFDVVDGKPVEIDLDKIVKGRALFQANSGGGKSYIVRKFLEETNGHIQQIVIDPEGEYSTLREKYNYLLIGKSDADIPIDTRHAEMLARKLLETNADAIIDLYEMSPFERIKFVKVFCDALVNLPKKLWHPCLIIIDEIHVYAPETKSGRSESLEAVASLASRGRKRGYTLIGATQKLSKFHKDVAAELNTKFTGRCTLDIDQKRAAQELGIKDHTQLRNLDYEFFLFGPGIEGIKKVKSYPVKTTHEDIGTTKITKMAKKSEIDKMLKNFTELPKEAENELKTKTDLQRKVAEQSNEITKLRIQSTKPDKNMLENEYIRGWNESAKKSQSNFNTKISEIKLIFNDSVKNLVEFPTKINSIINADEGQLTLVKQPQKGVTIEKKPEKSFVISDSSRMTGPLNVENNNNLGRCENQILSALKQIQKPATKVQLGALAGYSFKSGGFGNSLSKLKSSGYIEQNGSSYTLTQLGLTETQDIDVVIQTHEALMNYWTNKLGKCPASILKSLDDRMSRTKEELGELTNYSANSGGFGNSLSKLKSLGLIEKGNDNSYTISEVLFP